MTTARWLLRLKAKVLHLYRFLTRRRQEGLLMLLFASGRPLVHQDRGALPCATHSILLSATVLLLADEVGHLLGAEGRVVGEAGRLTVLVVKFGRSLKCWSGVVELEVLLALEGRVKPPSRIIKYDVGGVCRVPSGAHPRVRPGCIAETLDRRHRHWTENWLELGRRGLLVLRGCRRRRHKLLLPVVRMRR